MEYIAYFYIYAFLGWCLEIVYQGFKKGRFINRGFLLGPWCPIYGITALLIIEGSRFFSSALAVFVMTLIVGSLLELIVGVLLNFFFHQRWWDYSEYPLNLKGYICPLFSFGWGICGVFLIKVLHPPIHFFYESLSNTAVSAVLGVLAVFFATDIVLTILSLLKINRRVKEIDELRGIMKKISDQLGEQVYERSTEALDSRLGKQIQLDFKEVKTLKELGFTKEGYEKVKEIRARKASFLEKRLISQFEKARSTKYKESFEDLKKNIRKRIEE